MADLQAQLERWIPDKHNRETSDLDPSRHRLYPGSKYHFKRDELVDVFDDVEVLSRPNGAYRINVGDRWAQVTPVNLPPEISTDARVTRIVETARCGDMIPDDLLPNTAQYRMTYSDGARVGPNGVELDRVDIGDGETLSRGLFIHDWNEFEPVWLGDVVSLNLVPRKLFLARRYQQWLDAGSPGVAPSRIIDLDPTPILGTTRFLVRTELFTSWTAVHHATAANDTNNATAANLLQFEAGFIRGIGRAGVRFDSSGEAASVSDAVMKCTTDGSGWSRAHLSKTSFVVWAHNNMYGEMRTNGFDIPANRIGLFTSVVFAMTSPDISDWWEKSSTFDFCVVESINDLANVQPGSVETLVGFTDFTIEFTAIEGADAIIRSPRVIM